MARSSLCSWARNAGGANGTHFETRTLPITAPALAISAFSLVVTIGAHEARCEQQKEPVVLFELEPTPDGASQERAGQRMEALPSPFATARDKESTARMRARHRYPLRPKRRKGVRIASAALMGGGGLVLGLSPFFYAMIAPRGATPYDEEALGASIAIGSVGLCALVTGIILRSVGTRSPRVTYAYSISPVVNDDLTGVRGTVVF